MATHTLRKAKGNKRLTRGLHWSLAQSQRLCPWKVAHVHGLRAEPRLDPGPESRHKLPNSLDKTRPLDRVMGVGHVEAVKESVWSMGKVAKHGLVHLLGSRC